MSELEIFERISGFFKTVKLQTIENTGLYNNDVVHSLHSSGSEYSEPFILNDVIY